MNKLSVRSLVHALLAFAYIFCVGLFMNSGLISNIPEIAAPVLILSLLVLSASIMAILIFGKPVLMYLDGQKKEAVKLLFYTLGWLALMFVLSILIVVLI